MTLVNALAWLDVALDGTYTGIHVRWYEEGELQRHDETWDDPLDQHEADALLQFVLGTAS